MPASAYAAAVLRIGLGLVFVAHALLKLVVLTLPGTEAFFEAHGYPGWTAYPVFAAELAGGAMLLAGLFTRLAAFGLVPVMAGAFLVHWPNGWSFTAEGGGWEYVAFLIVALVAQGLLGDGAWASSALLGRRLRPAGRLNASLLVLAAALPLASCTPGNGSPPAESEAGHNERLGRRYFEEVWNRGELEVLDELLAPGYVNHTPSVPDPALGPAGLAPIVAEVRRAFPDLQYRVEDVVATDDAVVMRVVMTGTHLGALFGLPATGRRIRVNQINIERIRDGRIAEHWRVTDELALMRQLGVVR
jgi:steroid delta-isomerase-like uncharacterized protein